MSAVTMPAARDTQGWKVLGYASFEEMGEREFGFTRQRANQLATAAKIELSLNLETLVSNPTERQLRPLSQVPAEERQAIWDQLVPSQPHFVTASPPTPAARANAGVTRIGAS